MEPPIILLADQSTSLDWLSLAIAIVLLVVTIVQVHVSVMQHRETLHERRFKVFVQAKELVRAAVESDDCGLERLRWLGDDIPRSFVFPPTVTKYCDELADAVSGVMEAKARWRSTLMVTATTTRPLDAQHDRLVKHIQDEMNGRIADLELLAARMDRVFEPHLRLYSPTLERFATLGSNREQT